MSKFDVKIDTTEAVKKTKALMNIPKATRYQLTKWGSEFERYLKQVATTGRYIGRYKGGVRTGALRRSIKQKLSRIADGYKLEIGTVGSKYARILERGGTIRPRRKQYLTIPLPGVKGWARNYKNAFFIESRKGNLLLAQKKGKKGLKPLFVLKKSVKIPAFRWLEKSMKDRKGKLDRMLNARQLYLVAKKMK